MDVAERFWADGFVVGLPGLSPREAGGFVRRLNEVIEAHGGWRWRDRHRRPGQDQHPLHDWLDGLARHPAIAEAVSSVLGEDLRVRNHDVVVRPARSPFGSTWHRDWSETGPALDRMLTAWVALTESHRWNGCVRFVPGSHRIDTAGVSWDPRWRLRRLVDADLRERAPPDTRRQVWAQLRPGQISLHHPRTLHGSGPNWTGADRIGFVMRFLADDADPDVAGCGEALLVRGRSVNPRIRVIDAVPMRWPLGWARSG